MTCAWHGCFHTSALGGLVLEHHSLYHANVTGDHVAMDGAWWNNPMIFDDISVCPQVWSFTGLVLQLQPLWTLEAFRLSHCLHASSVTSTCLYSPFLTTIFLPKTFFFAHGCFSWDDLEDWPTNCHIFQASQSGRQATTKDPNDCYDLYINIPFIIQHNPSA